MGYSVSDRLLFGMLDWHGWRERRAAWVLGSLGQGQEKEIAVVKKEPGYERFIEVLHTTSLGGTDTLHSTEFLTWHSP